MYCTVEGKKFLQLLYLLGLALGSILMNLMVSMKWVSSNDFFQFIVYLKNWDAIDTSSLFSYIFFTRIRQLILMFLSFLFISPYLIFCAIDFVFSFLLGGYFSCAILNYGVKDYWRGILVLFPHGICYLLFMVVLYLYLFQKNSIVLPIRATEILKRSHWIRSYKIRQLLNDKMFTAIILIALFLFGCYTEAVWNPWILKHLA